MKSLKSYTYFHGLASESKHYAKYATWKTQSADAWQPTAKNNLSVACMMPHS